MHNNDFGISFRYFIRWPQTSSFQWPGLTEGYNPKGGDRTKSSSTAWQAEWNTFFSAKEDSSPPEDVDTAYKTLMSRFSEELGVAWKEESRSYFPDRTLKHDMPLVG